MMRFTPATGAICLILSGIPLHAEVRLLTGDANDQIHGSSSDVVDVSADGDYVAFISGPPVSGSTPGITAGGLYVRQLSTGTLEYVGGNSGAYIGVGDGAISDDARYAAWYSTNHSQSGVSGNANHIYWKDRVTGTTRLITAAAERLCRYPEISGDGRYVTFISASRNLVPDASKLPTVDGRYAVYLYDSQTEALSIVSLAADGSALTGIASTSGASVVNAYDFSSDGRFIVYSTDSANAHSDRSTMAAAFMGICRRELSTGNVELLNRNEAGTVINGNFTTPRISADGNRCAFVGSFVGFIPPVTPMVTDVVATTAADIYLKDVTTGGVWWVSKTTDGTPHSGVFDTTIAISGAGDVVAFASSSTKLTTDESDPAEGGGGSIDVFRADIGAAGAAGSSGAVTTSLITRSPTNSGNVGHRGNSPHVSGNGEYVVFNTSQLPEMIGSGPGQHQGVGVGTFPGPSGGAMTYASWASGLPANQRGFTDMPAGDGVDNLTKYLMGMDPTVPDRSKLPFSGKATGAELGLAGDMQEYFTLTVRIRRGLAAGFAFSVRASDQLTGMSAGSAVQVGDPTPDGDFDLYLYRYPTPISASPGRGFMSVDLSGPP